MSFLSPLSLLWLAAVPALLWLWRLSATRREVPVPSLIPFERLLRRRPRRRTRLIVNALFWLQLAGLLLLALALGEPTLLRQRPETFLVILDTSASMGARIGQTTAFARAQRGLRMALARKRHADQWFVVATAPAGPLLPQPTGDEATLRRVIDEARVRHLGGHLATTARIGRALLGAEPDGLIVATDEPAPEGGSAEGVQWVRAGRATPNLALVGLDAQTPLCAPSSSRLVATVHNFSDDPVTASLRAVSEGGQALASTEVALGPGARRAISLELPPEARGWAEVRLQAPRDGLAVDNRAWAEIGAGERPGISVRVRHPGIRQAVASWLDACSSLAWSEMPPEDAAAMVITDEEAALSSASAGLVFEPPAAPRPVLSRWLVSPEHPIGAYLSPLDVTRAAVNLAEPALQGAPVISALGEGWRIPVVVAGERDGRRTVWLRLDPSGSEQSSPVFLAFFNSLRWLLGRQGGHLAGEPLVTSGFGEATARVTRPDGRTDQVEPQTGVLRYDAVDLAGFYRIAHGTGERREAVNFFDPLESNLLQPVSTWRSSEGAPASRQVPAPAPQPIWRPLAAGALVLLLAEWWRYTARPRRHTHPGGSADAALRRSHAAPSGAGAR